MVEVDVEAVAGFWKCIVFSLQPLQVMDPDHPLAALVRKAQQEKNGNLAITTKPEEAVAAQAPPTDYTTDRKYNPLLKIPASRLQVYFYYKSNATIFKFAEKWYLFAPISFLFLRIRICYFISPPNTCMFPCPTLRNTTWSNDL